ncbi:hypothetical protein MASR2M39_24730 [Ignavibacteriales bacterium]
MKPNAVVIVIGNKDVKSSTDGGAIFNYYPKTPNLLTQNGGRHNFYIVGLIQDTSAGQVTAEKYLNTKNEYQRALSYLMLHGMGIYMQYQLIGNCTPQ